MVNDGLTDKVLELRDFETLEGEGLIEKIEISVVELKIATNFRRVNKFFSINIKVILEAYLCPTRMM